MKNLYGFSWDCGRAGCLEGKFFATPEEIKTIVGKDIQFGEVLGKHSDISGTMEANEISLITDNQEFIKQASVIGVDLESGYNPLDYLE